VQARGVHDDAGVNRQLLHHELDACRVVGAVVPRRRQHKHVVIERLDDRDTAGYLEIVGEKTIRVRLERNSDDARMVDDVNEVVVVGGGTMLWSAR
jgi:hypothetical protein